MHNAQQKLSHKQLAQPPGQRKNVAHARIHYKACDFALETLRTTVRLPPEQPVRLIRETRTAGRSGRKSPDTRVESTSLKAAGAAAAVAGRLVVERQGPAHETCFSMALQILSSQIASGVKGLSMHMSTWTDCGYPRGSWAAVGLNPRRWVILVDGVSSWKQFAWSPRLPSLDVLVATEVANLGWP